MLTPYIALLRLEKPIGIWLLFFPASWAVAIAAPDEKLLPLLALMLLGATVTRAAGCILNDLADRKLDAQVERTKNRPLASGTVPGWHAILLLGILRSIALLSALSLPRTVFHLALLALPMIAAYPWMKRITWWPQLFLGLTFNLSLPMAWAATGMPLTATPWLLYAAAICWTLGYDTIYAVQDMADDAIVGIRSTARVLGPRLPRFVGGMYAAMVALAALAGIAAQAGPAYGLSVAVMSLHAISQCRRLPPNPTDAGAIFRSNQWLGLGFLLPLLLARLLETNPL